MEHFFYFQQLEILIFNLYKYMLLESELWFLKMDRFAIDA